ncbi:HAMP domain-containing protein [Pseudoalteromonas sp. CO325X]|uniref:ATP-binding protein n=1 Tax=Pseudoalteromonas TaxID=53246 RepID=UPI001023366E|nr:MULTISPECIES: ATP-binding protein [Pseudoalteromonas]RZF77226.1 HAMP domain-containing protein [Pseudoalteromonas sp. CO325X]|tara:strand:+ start:4137 stop:5756 length:1620 start_codon:yes stop_codon:yes gene_type:complete
MSIQGSTTSIRKALIYAVMSVASLSLILSITISTYIDIQEQREQLEERVETFAELTAFNAQVTVLFDDSKTEEQRLQAFQAVEAIKNIHIYRIDEFNDEVEFFASYNAPRTPPVPVKTKRLESIGKGEVEDGHLEIIKAITNQDNTIGYVYVRASLESIENYLHRKIIIDIMLSVAVLVVAYVIARIFQRHIGNPIDTLSQLLQDVAKNRNYTVRAPSSNIAELNQLALSVNTMLRRTEKQIERNETDKKEIEALNQSLEEKVNLRTDALRDANQELLSTLERMHQYQNQIVENEKMASLGQMVAGVAHEVNTPLGLGITASTLMRDKLGDIRHSFEEKTLTSQQLGRFLVDGEENLSLIYRNLNRAAELIASFKKVAVTQDSESITDVNLSALIGEVMISMRADLDDISPQINVHCPEDLHIQSKSGPIQQILQQLISNSLIHAFKDHPDPRIDIDVQIDSGQLQIDYRDNGSGISETLKPRVFDPFVTTKRGSGGSGLGLHLVYNLVTQALGGKVLLAPEHKQGSHFIVQIPLSGVQ